MKTLLILSDEDLDKYCNEFDVSNVEDLSSKLFLTYGIVLVDDRISAEYSQVNAQHSPEFFNEEMTQDEFVELLESKSIYGVR